jgi:hypothetical protein
MKSIKLKKRLKLSTRHDLVIPLKAKEYCSYCKAKTMVLKCTYINDTIELWECGNCHLLDEYKRRT